MVNTNMLEVIFILITKDSYFDMVTMVGKEEHS